MAHIAHVDRPTRLWCVIASLAPDIDGLALVGIAMALVIAVRHGRTPLEFVHPTAERAVVNTLRQRCLRSSR